MFTTKCYIRKNTLELQQRLKKLGYSICICAAFNGAVWLSTNTETSSVHGKGFVDDSGWSGMDTQEKALAAFLHNAEKDGYIDCGEDERKFLALAAMQDDSDKHQYCVDCLGNWFMYNRTYISLLNQTNVTWHKATKEEILKHFK